MREQGGAARAGEPGGHRVVLGDVGLPEGGRGERGRASSAARSSSGAAQQVTAAELSRGAANSWPGSTVPNPWRSSTRTTPTGPPVPASTSLNALLRPG